MKRRFLIGIILLGLIILSISFYFFKNAPLKWDHTSTYEKGDGIYDYSIGFFNDGVRSVKLKRVLIDDQEMTNAKLAIAYDSTHLIQPGLDTENVKLYTIQEKSIAPKLTPDEISEAFAVKKQTPISYGIIIENQLTLPTKIQIDYTYFGIPFSLEIGNDD